MSNPDSPTLTLLHLSDLHFGQDRGEGRVHFDQLKVVGELLKDARAMRDRLGSPDAILVTGDIAFAAHPDQYRQAGEWLRELASAVGVTSHQVYMVPGNHDVDRAQATKPLNRKLAHAALRSDPSGLNDCLLKEHVAELASSLWPKLEPYATFARGFGAPALNAESPFWRREITSPLGNLLLVGLNSCLLSLDGTDAKTNLALSQAQLHRLLEPLPDHALTLALMHHPPEWLSDGEELLKELQKGPHLLFSGHIHAAGGGVLHGLGQGSRLRFDAGASHAAPDEPGRHEYAWIRLSHDGLDWYPRIYSTKRNAFKADGDRLEDQQIHQRLEPGQLPKPLRAWVMMHTPMPAPDSTQPLKSVVSIARPTIVPATSRGLPLLHPCEADLEVLPLKERLERLREFGRTTDPRLGLEKPENWIWIEPGTFTMGDDDEGRPDASPAHLVEIAQGFFICRFPITYFDFIPFWSEGVYRLPEYWSNEGWRWRRNRTISAVDKVIPPGKSNHPVVGVCWWEAEAFGKWLQQQPSRLPPDLSIDSSGLEIRLPTEAEWEYAARGTASRWHPWGESESYGHRANVAALKLGDTTPVGAFPAGKSPEGVQDLIGNVWEWCLDWHSRYSKEAQVSPQGAATGEDKVLRGGSFRENSGQPRSFTRTRQWPHKQEADYGFRLICSPSRAGSLEQ